ncbi:MAG: DNA cytosine methyltransferase [Alphaproteobacteria bacterium]|nr:DNA cytosine methyltransferase [Alphaproteobacteria bacterium]MBU0799253.1 DNA cytosine methyltransferase [Alphaproteobacteria bacterium]MBU0885558.1 DNA cytosine methyltransferase [Alphaproteobacteria bacterium]MBU1812965.1 DNA cytosine methyltransferase [Alphaproteobacteria bacterium]
MSVAENSIAASVVDLFCGAGGLSHGFKQEAFKVAAGIDIDEACRFPYEANNDAPFLRKDVEKLTAKEVDDLFIPRTKRVLVGCAPCQPFSTYNQKNEDPNWKLLHAFGDIIEKTEPDVVSMENVPRLLAFRGGAVFNDFIAKLEATEYTVAWDILYGPDFGLAQTRSRLVLLASRLGPIAMPKPTHAAASYRTVRDEIGALPSLAHGEIDERDPLHRASRLSETNARRIASAKPGGTWRDWDQDLVADCHKVSTGKGYSSVYGRMSWTAPSPTITTQFYGFGNGRFGHPEQDRALTLREGALLQGFPRDYQFVAPGEQVHFKRVGRMIGNAVPVTLASAIARAVKLHLESVQ